MKKGRYPHWVVKLNGNPNIFNIYKNHISAKFTEKKVIVKYFKLHTASEVCQVNAETER